ncbi:MAG: hypothetical protein IJH50_12995 [Kiritimatiellae bacterium]|nr:hypothetical protein [Kiritimatiellia bacterium]
MKKSLLIIGATVMAIATQTANAADDPYIESDGTSGISTGYRMKGTSRLEVDFALTEQTEQARIFGDDAGYETSLKTILYVSGGATHFAMTTGNGTSTTTRYKAGTDTGRHTAIIDLPNDKVQMFTGDTAVLDTTTGVSGGFAGKEANMPLPLFGRWGNAYASKFLTHAKARIYGVKIFESGVLMRNFVPCLKDGVACFKDLVGGGFIVGENVAAFTAGGDAPTYIDDAYVSTANNAVDGALYIDTGYKVSDRTAVALDYAFTVNAKDNLNPGYWSLFECSGGVRFRIDFNKYAGLRYTAGGNGEVTTLSSAFDVPDDDKDVRRTVFLDNLNASVGVVMSGYTNQTDTFTVNTASQPNGTTLKLASTAWGSDGYAAIKIYGCKIWEDGALVRDFVPYVENGIPGMRDRLTGAFIDGKDYSGGGNQLAYGGTITGERDAYLESNGTTGLNTGCKIKGTSRIEFDFALTEAEQTTLRIFGTDTQESVLMTWLGTDGSGYWRMVAKANSTEAGRYPPATPTKCDTARHTAIMSLDSANGGTYDYRFVTGSTTNTMTGTFTNVEDLEASMPLPIFARYGNAEGTSFHSYTATKARLYSLRIYESNALMHEFLPYGRDGVVGLYDTVTGEIISNGSSFTFGGMGQDHGQLKAYIKPGYSERVNHGSSVPLTAYAPGATSYRWLRDGQPIDGGTDGVLSVEWARGGTKTADGYVHTYQAIAVFNDFYGVSRESEPTEAATVTSVPFGMVISVK